MDDESPWETKSQIMVRLGKSSRTVDLWVRAGRIERMQDGSRAYFRLATPGNAVTPAQPAATSPELVALLTEMREELRALRAEVAALSALPPAQLPPGYAALPGNAETTHEQEAAPPASLPTRNEAQPGNATQRRSWWRRFVYGP
ncbi:MAG: hypothetical protein LC793_25085 [Thermomicrobia bacterium]|nr:hypothetical protein [Thermomicrobia bacterium]